MAWESRAKLRLTVSRLIEEQQAQVTQSNLDRKMWRDQREEILSGIKAFFKLHPRMAEAYMVNDGWGNQVLDIDKFLTDCREQVAERDANVAVNQRKARLASGKLEDIKHG